jgi:hypothetical protein
MCNSSHSRLLGFFGCLPGIWRALQCIRRYHDTRNAFPHLANCGKYAWTILYYMSLSLYRLDKTDHLRAFFILCGTINSIYCIIWDLVMDWSELNSVAKPRILTSIPGLIDPTAKHRFLRENLAFNQVWMYYLAILIDPILRFNWIFYAIYANDVQHSAILSFLIALSEVFRRGMWTVFRVENEHCTNVGRFRASRDIPLPYHLESSQEASEERPQPGTSDEEEQRHTVSPLVTVPSRTSGMDVSRTHTHASASSTVRRRKQNTPSPLIRGMNRVGTILHMAHSQDFERRRSPDEASTKDDGADDSSDDDQEHAEEEELEEEIAAAASVREDGQGDGTSGDVEDLEIRDNHT